MYWRAIRPLAKVDHHMSVKFLAIYCIEILIEKDMARTASRADCVASYGCMLRILPSLSDGKRSQIPVPRHIRDFSSLGPHQMKSSASCRG